MLHLQHAAVLLLAEFGVCLQTQSLALVDTAPSIDLGYALEKAGIRL
jgi:hypothetical protein